MMTMHGVDTRFKNLLMCFEEHLAVLILKRPEKLNALNSEVLDEMDKALDEIENNSQFRVLLITGSGEKAFVAGADIGELRDLGPRQGKKAAERGQKLFRRLERSRLFVIAGVNGFALGGGMELALACDMRVASDNAVLGLPEVGLGIIPGYGGTQRLPRLVGRGRALWMIATGEKVPAPAAYNLGLVDWVVTREQLMPYCRDIALKIARNGPLAVAAAKRAVVQGLDLPLDQGLAVEAKEFGKLCSTHDRTEGMTAFLEKRPPVFKGE